MQWNILALELEQKSKQKKFIDVFMYALYVYPKG
jgi:hypothetical protein